MKINTYSCDICNKDIKGDFFTVYRQDENSILGKADICKECWGDTSKRLRAKIKTGGKEEC